MISGAKTTFALVFSASLVLGAGCGGTTPATSAASAANESVSEIGGSVIGGAVNFSSSVTSAALFGALHRRSWFSLFVPSAEATTTCPALGHATCSGDVIELLYQGCGTLSGTGATMTGTDLMTFTSGTCTSEPESHAVTFTRTFPDELVETDPNGQTVTTNTQTASGWKTQVAGGGTTFTIDPTANTRSIQINGIHLVAAMGGSVLWDQTYSTPSPLVFDQTNQAISGGTLSVQHNIALYTAQIQITTPLQFQAGTCNPVAGKVTTVLSGSRAGTQTLEYAGNNQAVLVNTHGVRSTVTLSHCF